MSPVEPPSPASSSLPFQRTLGEVRAATSLANTRPAYAAGIRAALATVIPLLVDHYLHTGGGTWMSLAGFSGALADKGGPYRTRAATLASLTLAGAVTATLGAVVGEHPAIAVPATLAIAFACSLARAYGNAGASVGVAVLNIYVISLAYPPLDPGEAVSRAGFVLVGGGWAMVVALMLWPLRPYRPARVAVASAYRAVADYADRIAAWTRRDSMPEAPQVRSALETGRAALATVRRGRPGESGRGERLLILHETADQLFGNLFALAEVLESVPAAVRPPGLQATVAHAAATLAGTARAVAAAIEEEIESVPVGVQWSGAEIRSALAGATLDPVALAHYEQAGGLFDRMAQYAGVAGTLTAGLNAGAPPLVLERERELEDPEPRPSWLAPLRAALSPNSMVLHFAVRVGIVTAAAVALAAAFHLKRGYWMTITAVTILQPYVGLTTQRALQRVLGTMVGAVLTALLAFVFHDTPAIYALVFVLSATSVALLPLNYAAFSVFLTPTFVLLAEATAGDWHLTGLRALNTLLGGVLALAGSRLLWPNPEAERVPHTQSALLLAMRRYLELVVGRFDDRSEAASRLLRAARREAGLAILNADESLERLIGEHRGRPEEITPAMTLVIYARRFTASTAALALSRHAAEMPSSQALAPWASAADAILADLAATLAERRPPEPWAGPPDPDDPNLPPLLRGRLTRLARQLRTLHDAVERIVAAERLENGAARR